MTPESKNGRSKWLLMLSCVIWSFTTLFNGRDIITYVQAGNRRKTSRMSRSWSTIFIEHIRRSRWGHEVSFRPRMRRKGIQFRHSDAEEMGWVSGLGSGGKASFGRSLLLLLASLLSLIGPARYKWPWHGIYHHRIIVKWRWSFPVHRIRRIIVRFVLYFLSIPVWRYAAQEACAYREGWCNGEVVYWRIELQRRARNAAGYVHPFLDCSWGLRSSPIILLHFYT